MNKIFSFLLFLALTFTTYAQEINARLNVSAARLQTADPRIFTTLQDELTKFINERKWTDVEFADDEKIECNININITDELSADRYKAQVSIQANRPVFNSDYKTPIINYNDRQFEFQYQEFQALDFNENAYQSELTSFVAYWIYMIIGMDFDTFKLNGGQAYFQKAQNVVNNAQNSSSSQGWQPFGSNGNQNRYWYIENLLNNRYKNLREVNYKYHRLGLDAMYEDEFTGREQVAACVELLERVYRESPTLMALQMFFINKSDEIVQILEKAAATEKTKTVALLSKMDPGNASKYDRIMQSTGVGNNSRGR